MTAHQLVGQNLGTLTVEKIMRDPKLWIGTAPADVSWSEDSKTVFFKWNPEKNLGDSLYRYSIAKGSIEKVSPNDRRNMPSTEGTYTADFSKKIFEKNGDIFILDCKIGGIVQLTHTIDKESAPGFLQNGKYAFYQRGNNLYSVDLATGTTFQLSNFNEGSKKTDKKLTDEERTLKAEQLAMFRVLAERKMKKDSAAKLDKADAPRYAKSIYLEDSRLTNLKISPDARYITYGLSKADKSAKTTIVPNYVTESGYTEELQARTKVGAPAATDEFWVLDTKTDSSRKLILKTIPGFKDKPDYLKDYPELDSVWTKKDRALVVHGPFWSEKGSHGIVVIRSLDNKDRWIMQLNPETLDLQLIDRQRDEAWIGGPGIGGYPMSAGEIGWISEDEAYFQSEESGYSHLYSFNFKTNQKKALTKGKFEIQKVVLSRSKQHFFLTTNESHPGEQHIYKMSVNGGERTKLTSGTGAHNVTISPDETTIADLYSDSNTPWELFVNPINSGDQKKQITQSTLPEFKSYPWREAKVVTIKAGDGEDIYARVYEPKKSNGKAVIFVHGAGYLQNAHKWWSQYFREYMFNNLLTDKGYTVLDMDYRASSGYGRNWRTGIYRFMGGKDLSDHTDGAKWLVKNYKVNPGKIGIYGGSYGGFITLMGLFTTPDVFKAGAALRPVTDWAAYNHPYTSNILNEPQWDSLSYAKSSPIYHAAGLKNNLLICHGMVDVNVHYQDVVRLSQRLIELGKDNWELAAYPMEDHGFVEPSSWTDEYKRILKLFEEKLK